MGPCQAVIDYRDLQGLCSWSVTISLSQNLLAPQPSSLMLRPMGVCLSLWVLIFKSFLPPFNVILFHFSLQTFRSTVLADYLVEGTGHLP